VASEPALAARGDQQTNIVPKPPKAAVAGGDRRWKYMLGVMRDPKVDPHRRDYTAKAAAAYVHPRLNSTEVAGNEGRPLVIEITPDEGKKPTDDSFDFS
jgi:hypothetical protein